MSDNPTVQRAEIFIKMLDDILPGWRGYPSLRNAAAGLLADPSTPTDEALYEAVIPAFEDDPVAMSLGFTPVKPGVLLPGTPEHCHRCALDEVERLRAAP